MYGLGVDFVSSRAAGLDFASASGFRLRPVLLSFEFFFGFVLFTTQLTFFF